MKILEVTNLFSPVHGGSAEVPCHLSKELAKRGHEVILYTSDFKLSQEYLIPVPEVKIHAFKTWLSLAGFQVTPGIIRKTKEEIRHLDIIHMHNYRTFQNIVVHHYAKKCGVPYVLQARGSLPRIMTKQKLKQIYDILWGYRLLKDATRLIALTPLEAEQYKNMGVSSDKIEVVPNAIDLSEFENLPERGEFRKRWSIKESQKIILSLSRIHRIKGLDLLAKAFAELSKEIDDAKLVIAGPDSGYLPMLKRLIKELKIEEKVLFTGFLHGRDKLEAYVAADVFVLPSIYEIFGNVVLEACACGTPVVVTDHCGIADAVDGQAGLVVPYDKKALGKAILEILSDEKKRQEFGERGKSLVRQRFDWLKIAEQIEHTYASCISSGRQIMG